MKPEARRSRIFRGVKEVAQTYVELIKESPLKVRQMGILTKEIVLHPRAKSVISTDSQSKITVTRV